MTLVHKQIASEVGEFILQPCLNDPPPLPKLSLTPLPPASLISSLYHAGIMQELDPPLTSPGLKANLG